MSEVTPVQNVDQVEDSGFTPPATQDELNKIIEARLGRERAKYADYDDLRSKAAEFDKLEEANKTEQERLQERLQAAEAAAAQARTDASRYKVATKYGISDADADLFLTAADEETLVRQAEQLAAYSAKPSTPRPDPSAGVRGANGGQSNADVFAAIVDDLL